MRNQLAEGQVWESTDPRDAGRLIEILHVSPTFVEVLHIDTGRRTKIARHRLRPLGQRGYRLKERV